MTSQDRAEVYAVVRFDGFIGQEVPPELALTIKEVLPTLEEAQREARRLNDLVTDKNIKYFVQATRWFPAGRTRRASS